MFFSLSPIVGNCKNETEWKIRKRFEDAKRSIERRELTRREEWNLVGKWAIVENGEICGKFVLSWWILGVDAVANWPGRVK